MDKVIKATTTNHIEIIAQGYSGYSILRYLDSCHSEWEGRIEGIAFLQSCHSVEEFKSPSILELIRDRTVNFLASEKPVKTMLNDDRFGSICVSGGCLSLRHYNYV